MAVLGKLMKISIYNFILILAQIIEFQSEKLNN